MSLNLYYVVALSLSRRYKIVASYRMAVQYIKNTFILGIFYRNKK